MRLIEATTWPSCPMARANILGVVAIPSLTPPSLRFMIGFA